MVYEAKTLIMDEFMPDESGRVKLKLSLLLLHSICFHFTYAAYPLERDVAELVKLSPPKRWIPFMQRLAKICLNEVKSKESMAATDVLRCLARRNTASPQCLSTHFISRTCKLTYIYSNTLKFGTEFRLQYGLRIQIVIHPKFSLNFTVKYISFTDTKLSFEIMGKTYSEQNFSTIIIPNNRMEIIFYGRSSMHFEYSVTQYLNVTNYHKLRANAMHFVRGYFLVTCFQIQVDIMARLSLDNITCSLCKMIVYDGPNEKLPIIVKNDDVHRFQRVVASTAKVFMVVIENVPEQDVLVTYSSIYKTNIAFNITEYEYTEINFDNYTSCNGHSRYARSCVYTFYTSARKQMKLSLTHLHFTEFTKNFQTTTSKAGIIKFNHFRGVTEDILELNCNLMANNSFFEIIGTGYIMHIVVFVYSILASLSFTFSVSPSDCDILLVSGNYVSYSGYVTPINDTSRVFMMKQSSQALHKYDSCLRLQFITPLSRYKMIFPHNSPALIATYNEVVRMCQSCPFSCLMLFQGRQEHTFYKIDDQAEVRTLDSITIDPCECDYIQIVIYWLPCKLPCQYIVQASYCDFGHGSKQAFYDNDDNSACDICENIYTGCRKYSIDVETDISYILRVKSNVCLSAHLLIMANKLVRELQVLLAFNVSMFRMPVFRRATRAELSSIMCNIEIPVLGLLRNSRADQQLKESTHDVKDAYWGGVLYRRLFQLLPVSLEIAALSCQVMGASLLTIHGSAEYQFLKDTFLQKQDTSILYVGTRRQVMCICVL